MDKFAAYFREQFRNGRRSHLNKERFRDTFEGAVVESEDEVVETAPGLRSVAAMD